MSYRMRGRPLKPQIIAGKRRGEVPRFVKADGFVSDRVDYTSEAAHRV